MKQDIKMYTVKCDICGKYYADEHSGFCAWTDYGSARDGATDSGWIEDWQQGKDQKHYCPDCYEINDEDEVINKNTGEFIFNN